MHEGGEQDEKALDAMASGVYPELSEADRREAVANLRHYFEIAVAIADEAVQQRRGLTSPESVPTMKERSNVDLKN